MQFLLPTLNTTNSHRYVSRGLGELCQTIYDGATTWPDCKSHYELTTENNDFYSWVWTSEDSPHAPVHLWLGGNLDCDRTYEKIGDLVGSDVARQLAYLANGHRKRLFYAGVWGCSRPASMDETPAEVRRSAVYLSFYVGHEPLCALFCCIQRLVGRRYADLSKIVPAVGNGLISLSFAAAFRAGMNTPTQLLKSGTCGCLGYDLTQGYDYKAVLASLAFADYYIEDFSDDVQRQIVEMTCSGVLNYGEQGQVTGGVFATTNRLSCIKGASRRTTDVRNHIEK